MSFAVFAHRADSIYDDRPAEQYQFPKAYLGRVSAAVGDWIVYYEPLKAGAARGYFALAKVERISTDRTTPGMYLALMTPGSFLQFAQPVPFKMMGRLTEQGLLNESGTLSGWARSAVRRLSPGDFHRILDAGFPGDRTLLQRVDSSSPAELRETTEPFHFEDVSQRLRSLTSRIVRDRVFRQIVLQAYDQRCAVSGLRLLNGGGRAEVEAAHIQAVHASGPDVVNNGIALSGTAHWMFDRGLISFDDDLGILISRHVNDQQSVTSFLNETRYALAPNRPIDRPHPHFLRWHREHCFKR